MSDQNFTGYSVQLIGGEELEKMLKQAPEMAKKHFRTAMTQSVTILEKNIKELAPVGVSGRLANSIASNVTGVGSNITGEVGSTMKEIYPTVMEFGRRPGNFPPPQAFHRWVQLVLKVPQDDIANVAFLIARSIARKGIKGRRYMQKGFDKSVGKINEYFDSALDYLVVEMAKK